MRTLYSRWAERHTNRWSLLLHIIGIPLTVAALPVLLFSSLRFAALLFIAGYALQFIGHALEGNKSGEQLLMEKLFKFSTKD
ncbi:MAG: DUF962 domain-containing protein [Candidatus Aureabacteria bacterium]|nr:DUF962 domain-containing protein [Candidatus Auribacterota bacterium]